MEGNTFSVNLFLFLSVIGFFIAGIDLSTELAREKQEINFVLDNLEDGCNIPQLSAKGLEDIFRPFELEIPFLATYIFGYEYLTSNEDRGPPAA